MNNVKLTNKSREVFVYVDDFDSVICFVKSELWEEVLVEKIKILSEEIIERIDLSEDNNHECKEKKDNIYFVVSLIEKIAITLFLPKIIIDDITENYIIIYKKKIVYCANMHLAGFGNKYDVLKNEDLLVTICWEENKRNWLWYFIFVVIVSIVFSVVYKKKIYPDEKETQTTIKSAGYITTELLDEENVVDEEENVSQEKSREQTGDKVEVKEKQNVQDYSDYEVRDNDEFSSSEKIQTEMVDLNKDEDEYLKYFLEGDKAYRRYFSDGKQERDRIEAIRALKIAQRYKNNSEVNNMLNILSEKQ